MNIITTPKPWGSFTRFTHNEISTVKFLNVTAGEELSLQRHHKREEFWKVVSGHPKIVIGDEENIGNPGDEFTIPIETKHRIGAPTDDVVILEISLGDFDEEDIVRLEDKYNRVV